MIFPAQQAKTKVIGSLLSPNTKTSEGHQQFSSKEKIIVPTCRPGHGLIQVQTRINFKSKSDQNLTGKPD